MEQPLVKRDTLDTLSKKDAKENFIEKGYSVFFTGFLLILITREKHSLMFFFFPKAVTNWKCVPHSSRQ